MSDREEELNRNGSEADMDEPPQKNESNEPQINTDGRRDKT